MNLHLLNTEIQKFITENLNSDILKLLFKNSSFDDVSSKEIVEQIEAKNKCKTKLPSWYSAENIYYPNKLNIEQTSSETAAQYKCSLIKGKSIIDITGGFGVDSFYFSKQFEKVIHCEINEELSSIANHNFNALKTYNISCQNSDGIDYLRNSQNTFDWIFVDPSRRHDLKGKVFYLKDCLPNMVEHIDLLLEASNNVMVKVSPMLDLSIGISELKYVKEIHIVAINNEVKELLYIIDKEYNSKINIYTVNITATTNQKFKYFLEEESLANSSFSAVKKFLFEPNSALMKAGAFNLISERFKIEKLNINSHLYTSDQLIEFPGRRFKVIKVLPYNKKVLSREIKSGKFNVSTRNFPDSVESIKKKYKLKDGGIVYLTFTTDFENNKIVIFTEKV